MPSPVASEFTKWMKDTTAALAKLKWKNSDKEPPVKRAKDGSNDGTQSE